MPSEMENANNSDNKHVEHEHPAEATGKLKLKEKKHSNSVYLMNTYKLKWKNNDLLEILFLIEVMNSIQIFQNLI
jgi:hypothetical protein